MKAILAVYIDPHLSSYLGCEESSSLLSSMSKCHPENWVHVYLITIIIIVANLCHISPEFVKSSKPQRCYLFLWRIPSSDTPIKRNSSQKENKSKKKCSNENKARYSSPLKNITGKCPYDISLKHSSEMQQKQNEEERRKTLTLQHKLGWHPEDSWGRTAFARCFCFVLGAFLS